MGCVDGVAPFNGLVQLLRVHLLVCLLEELGLLAVELDRLLLVLLEAGHLYVQVAVQPLVGLQFGFELGDLEIALGLLLLALVAELVVSVILCKAGAVGGGGVGAGVLLGLSVLHLEEFVDKVSIWEDLEFVHLVDDVGTLLEVAADDAALEDLVVAVEADTHALLTHLVEHVEGDLDLLHLGAALEDHEGLVVLELVVALWVGDRALVHDQRGVLIRLARVRDLLHQRLHLLLRVLQVVMRIVKPRCLWRLRQTVHLQLFRVVWLFLEEFA